MSVTASAQDAAKDEMRQAVQKGMTTASGINGNVDMFRAMAMPYGPLDLRVQAPDAPPGSIHGMRDFFYGSVGHAAGVDPLAIIKAFEACACTKARKDSAIAVLASARAVAHMVTTLHGHNVISIWPGGWTVDLLTYDGSTFTMRETSPVLGLIPWEGQQATRAQADAWLAQAGVSVDAISRITGDMAQHGLTAAERDENGNVRVMRAGSIASDATGFVFVAANHKAPAVGTVGRAGDKYVTITAIAPGVYYYETQ